jgi:uncharacterized protein (UPF0332 family)
MLSHERLNRIAKADGKLVNHWREGVSIEEDSESKIEDLVKRVAADRWRLAQIHKRNADEFLRYPTMYRAAISRYYYSMYHAIRACAYVFHGGDDFEDHSTLPQNIPDDYPKRTQCQSALKNARLARNRADYDPYPGSWQSWRLIVADLRGTSREVLSESRRYLRRNGCLV